MLGMTTHKSKLLCWTEDATCRQYAVKKICGAAAALGLCVQGSGWARIGAKWQLTVQWRAPCLAPRASTWRCKNGPAYTAQHREGTNTRASSFLWRTTDGQPVQQGLETNAARLGTLSAWAHGAGSVAAAWPAPVLGFQEMNRTATNRRPSEQPEKGRWPRNRRKLDQIRTSGSQTLHRWNWTSYEQIPKESSLGTNPNSGNIRSRPWTKMGKIALHEHEESQSK